MAMITRPSWTVVIALGPGGGAIGAPWLGPHRTLVGSICPGEGEAATRVGHKPHLPRESLDSLLTELLRVKLPTIDTSSAERDSFSPCGARSIL
jgi:hypothetical protein